MEMEDGTIMVNDWSFIGHCMLGSRPTKHGDVEVEPAYQCSRAISVAEQEEELELDFYEFLCYNDKGKSV